jgi:hypothetical protein
MSIYDTPIDTTIPESEVKVTPDVFEVDTTTKISNFKEFQAGAGSTVVKINKDGLFAGATNFTDAPFSVTYAGVLKATSGTFSGSVSIGSGTTYATGYDPTTKVDELAGTYASAATGPRVLLLPDSSTGIQITTGTLDVFKALVGGTDVGDVIIGDFANNKGIKWDNSATTFTVRGSLNADDITAGTLTGTTVKARTVGSTAVDVWMSGSTGMLEFRYNNSQKGYLTADSSGNVKLQSDGGILISPTGVCYIDSGDDIALFADKSLSLVYNDNGGTDVFNIINEGTIVAQFTDANNLVMNGGYLQGKYKSNDGTTGGDYSGGWGLVSSLRWNSGTLQAKVTTATVKDGLITNFTEGNWYNV